MPCAVRWRLERLVDHFLGFLQRGGRLGPRELPTATLQHLLQEGVGLLNRGKVVLREQTAHSR